MGRSESRGSVRPRQRSNYRVYRHRGRPVFAVPALPRRLRLAGLARFQPFTARRAVYRHLLGLSMRLGADRLLSSPAETPLPVELGLGFEDWLEQARRELGQRQASAVVFWPSQPERARIFVHLLDEEFEPTAFAKIAFDESAAECLRQEGATLGELQPASLRTCHVPRVLYLGPILGHTSLVLEPLPASAIPVKARLESYPSECVAEYAGEIGQVSPGRIAGLSWWERYRSKLDERFLAFSRNLEDLTGDGFATCRVHGDLGTNNMVRDGETLWIFDWEESRPDAPVLTDEIGFYLGLHKRRVSSDPVSFWRRLSRRYLEPRGPRRLADVMLALAFRHAANIRDATILMQHWDELAAIEHE